MRWKDYNLHAEKDKVLLVLLLDYIKNKANI